MQRSKSTRPASSSPNRRALALAATLGAAVAAGCRTDAAPADAIPRRSCARTVWHHASSARAQVEIVSSWSGWSRPGTLLPAERADGWRVAAFDLPPGEHSYAIVDDGQWLTDPSVGTTAFYEGREVSWITVGDCGMPSVHINAARGSSDGHAAVDATFFASKQGDRVAAASVAIRDAVGGVVATDSVTVDAATGAIALRLSGLAAGKHVWRISASDAQGAVAEPGLATAWIEPRAWDFRDAAIYQVMVDRYRGPAGPLAAPADAGGFAGGTVGGVRAALERGELTAMGFNTLWLSPLYESPTGAFPGADGRAYSGYHGYWPTRSRAIDPRFGTEADVDALIASAHARGVRVLFDVVPHHVHAQHPYVASHSRDGWFTDSGGACVCGAPSCSWASHIQDCWFTSYLPTLDWTRSDVADQLTSDVSWWLDRFDADGLRIDAVPMMPRAASRRMVADVRARFDHEGHATYLLGENFTGPGGYDSLRYLLGPFGLSGEFHFPLMWALRGAIAWQSEPLSAIDLAARRGQDAWAGSGAIMATMIGNHDVTRFASESAGDAGGDGWIPAPQPTSPLVYAQQRLALGVLYTLPGAPVVYYGDELGLAGRADPDARRVMPAESALTGEMRATRDFVGRLGALRACSAALRRGAYRGLVAEGEQLAFAREDDAGARALIIVQRSGVLPFDAPLPGAASATWIDALTGAPTPVDPTRTVLAAAPWSIRVLLPKGDPCLP